MRDKPNIVDVCSIKNLTNAYRKSTKARFKYKIAAMNFSSNLGFNIHMLREMIRSYRYENKGYSMFVIKDRKERNVHVPCFRDKVVQHAMNNVIKPMLEKHYIKDSYACITGKGPQEAIKTIKKYQYETFRKYRYPVLVKLDISKFFFTINRDEIFNLICKYIECEDLRVLIAEKLKFEYSPKGLPLGNLTSQQFANMLLNRYDHYAKRNLKIKYYVRYADDIFIIVDGKERAKEVMKDSIEWMKYELDLQCNPSKCYYIPATTIVALGYKIVHNKKTRKNMILLLSRNKNRLYKILKLKRVKDKSIRTTMLVKDKSVHRKGILRPATTEDIVLRLNSWIGHAKLSHLDKYILRTIKRNPRPDIKYENDIFKAVEGSQVF